MRLQLSCLLLVTACGSGGSDKASPGGNVSFGGAQDIGEFRSILDSGQIPGPDTLDANGFFNEHYVAPPPTSCGGTLCLTPGVSVGRDWLTGAHQATLQIAVNTPVDPATYPRLPLNLVVVVDHSGSMSQDGRLDKVKGGLGTLIDNLDPADRLALVEFDDTVMVDAPFGEILDRTRLHAVVDQLTPRGGTNIYDGLQKGFDLSTTAFKADHQNRVILLSDGLATVGLTDTSTIIHMADGYAERGIGLTTIGVGADFDVELMRGLAEHGAGNFYFLEDPAAATEVFTQELDFFATPLALGIDIKATAGTGFDLGDVFGSKLWQSSTRYGAMHIPAVFLSSRTSQSDPMGRRGGGSMIFIHLDPTGNNTDGKVVDLTLSYHLPGSPETVTQTVTLAYPNDPAETPAETYLSSPEMAERYAMYNMFLGFRFATNADPSCAAVALEALRGNATTWNSTHEDPDIAADLMLVDEYLGNLREIGATDTSGTTLETCNGADPYGDVHPHPMGSDVAFGCSASGKPSGFLVVVLAGLAAMRRRRRR